GRFLIETAGNRADAGFDRTLDHRRRVKDTVEDNRESATNIVSGYLSELLGALGIQGELNFGFAEIAANDLGIFNAAAGHFRCFLNLDHFGVFLAIGASLSAFKNFVTGLNNSIS